MTTTKTDLLPCGSKPRATTLLNNLGQSLWLDNITRDLLDQGTLKEYIQELSVTGLTSNPTIFEQAIKNSNAYDRDIRAKLKEGKCDEQIFFELALSDLIRAAESGRLKQKRIDDAMARQHDVKVRMRDRAPARPAALDVIGSAAHQLVAADMARWV